VRRWARVMRAQGGMEDRVPKGGTECGTKWGTKWDTKWDTNRG